MSTNDKTGDRLVASIRRTKAGAEKPTEVAAPPKKTSQRAATPRKTAAPARKRAATPTKKRAAKRPATAQGNYQSSGRVWPD